jgi:hypothetical protein
VGRQGKEQCGGVKEKKVGRLKFVGVFFFLSEMQKKRGTEVGWEVAK